MQNNVTLIVGLVLIFMTLSSSTRRNLIDSTEKRLLVRRIRKLPIKTYKPTNSYSTGESEIKTKNLGHIRHGTIGDLNISNTTIRNIDNDLEVSDSLNNKDRVRLEKMLQGKLREFTISDLIIDVIKEVIAELITEGIGGYLGLASKRTENFGWIDIITNAVKKATIDKRTGC